jgi:hypothetical protein
MANITRVEQEYMKAHSEYVRLSDSSSTTEVELRNARIKLDEVGKRLDEMYKTMEKEGCRFNPKFAKQEILKNLRLIYDQLDELDIKMTLYDENVNIFRYFFTGLQEGYRAGIGSFSKIQPPTLSDEQMPSIFLNINKQFESPRADNFKWYGIQDAIESAEVSERF